MGATRVSPGMTEREERLTKEYQALKERHTLVEAQLEAMRYTVGDENFPIMGHPAFPDGMLDCR